MFFKFIFTFLLFFSYSLKGSEVTVIELHKNKSLDQLVLEQENNGKNESVVESEVLNLQDENTTPSDISDESISELNTEDEIDTTNLQEESNLQNEDLEDVSVIQAESIFDIDEVLVAKMQFCGACKSMSLNMVAFIFMFSVAASTTNSALATPSLSWVCVVKFLSVLFFTSSVIFSLLNILSKFLVMVEVAFSKASEETSIKLTL